MLEGGCLKIDDKNKKKNKKSSKKGSERAHKLLNRLAIILAIAAAVLAAILIVPRVMESMGGSETAEEIREVSVSDVTHISFVLTGEQGTSGMTDEEFESALMDLYRRGYVLIDVYDIADKSEDGAYTLKDTIETTKNSRPLILSITGDYEKTEVLESFISRYPGFSYNNARAVLGVSGFYGILGYSSSESGKTKQAVDSLTSSGYHFACRGYEQDISYGAEYSIVKEDVKKWISEVASVVGDTDIMLLPKQTDIGSWSGYTEDNEKYKLLSEEGFKFYFVGNNESANLIQGAGGYIRMSVYEAHSSEEFSSIFA